MIGQTISHYKILEKIGEGGMSVVYRAEDTTLRRHVALKFPSEQVLADEAKKARFIQEARASAALDHPNICTLHEIDEAEGKTFISMAHIAGQSLYEKLQSGPLSLDEAVDISIQAAQGLYEAHEKGIVHRDIKSGNIMVTHSGQVKIMDFGLAKLAGETTETRLTQQGAIMGTVDYMSPEQAKGEPVDYRTDIWSLGVVMYEMLAGELPFKGGNAQAVIHSILYEEPKDMGELRRDVPTTLEQTVQKMIQKDPSSRPDSMKAVIDELESLSPRSGLSKEQVVAKRAKLKAVGVVAAILACVGILALLYLRPWAAQPSIAVLPFEDMSPDKDQEYFCDGMAEELINALSQIEDLRVIARTSAFSFKGKNVPIPDIGSQLKVATILEGSVRKAEDRLRITAQLVDTTGGHHLWSESYDRQMGDVFAIQAAITSAIVDKLRPKLLGKQKARLTKRQPVDLEAYDLYLKGLHFQNKRSEMDLKKAIEYFEQAIAEDPDYALAYAGLALSYGILPIYSPLPLKEAVQKGREAAQKALQIDETLAEAHASLGLIKTRHDWDWEGGEREYKQAIELSPGYAVAHRSYSFNLLFRARFDEALKEIEQALELDPVSAVVNYDLGIICFHAGQFDRAISASKRALEMDPSLIYAHVTIGDAYRGKSMYEQALIEFQKEREDSRRAHAWAEVGIGHVYAKMGKPGEAQKVLDNLLERSEQEYVSPFILACFHFVLGKNDEGFILLDQAYKEGDHWLCWLKIISDPGGVHSDPRYTALLEKMNLDK
ncbi:MAG: protein kinase domain-containing protein [Planctomycetota bacterium]|jgi:TolB-like protein/Tfp pilus assembly protein PilF/tRNA A-37 threonylcarbamoyl transferase component Bud32